MGAYKFSPEERRLYEKLPIPMAIYQVINDELVTILVSDQLCKLYGMKREDLIYALIHSRFGFVHPDDIGKLAYFGQQFMKLGNKFDYNVLYRTKTPGRDSYQSIHTYGRQAEQEDGTVLSFVFYEKVDETLLEIKVGSASYLEKSQDQLNRDALTGLPNRNFILNFAMQKVGRLRSDKEEPVAVLANISNMKGYNNQFGQAGGDELLVGVAKLLTEFFPNQIVARYESDRFLVLTSPVDLQERLAAIHEQFKQLVAGNAADISFGVYKVHEGDTIEEIMDRANFAISQIGNDRRRFAMAYDSVAEEKDLSENYCLDNLQKALDLHWIKVYFQPIYDNHTGQVSDYEALARWQDPVKGLLGPGQFIPVIEKWHLTYLLDRYMLEEVLKKLQAWKKNGVALRPISVNLSHEDFDRPAIVSELTELVDSYGVDHNLISIEITERDLSGDMGKLREKMRDLHALGFKFWMDDFGSGYSSLNGLYEYDFDLIKIDMKFVQHLDDNNGTNRKLMRSLVKVAKEMDILSLTEGVETEEEYAFVKQIGCDKTQGFLLAKPRPMDDFGRIL